MKPGKPIPVTLAPRAIMFMGIGTKTLNIMCPTVDIRLTFDDDETAMKAERSLREYVDVVEVAYSAEAIKRMVEVVLGEMDDGLSD